MALMLLGLVWLLLLGAGYTFLLSKCWFLAPYRAGWLMLIPNVVQETVERRLGVPRAVQDFGLLLGVPLGTGWLAGPMAGLAVALVGGAAWAGALLVELRWRADVPARQLAALRGRVPLPVPRLIVTLRGPVLARGPGRYHLGDWPEGTTQSFELLVLNPGPVRPQLPLRVTVGTTCPRLAVQCEGPAERAGPEPGQVLTLPFALRTLAAGAGGEVQVRVSLGDWVWARTLRLGAIPAGTAARCRQAEVRRWKHGARGAFVWRGDHDLYDPGTLQCAAGLRRALGLAARFRMPA